MFAAAFWTVRLRAESRACYATQKTIAGSIEMYNLDRATKVTGLTPELFRTLKSGGYLQSISGAPCGGRGSAASLQFTRAGNRVRCDVHGTIQ